MNASSDVTKMNSLRQNVMNQALAPAALMILYVFFGIFGRNFFSYPTLVSIIDAAYYIGFISIGVTFVIITGGIDLSVGTVMMAGAIIGGTAYKSWGWSIGASLVLIVLVGIAFGFFNGLMVSRLKMPPFIVTLGTMMISMGVGSIVSKVQSATFPTRGSADGWFKNIFKVIGDNGISIPTGAILLLAIAVISHIILSSTKMGRYTYAIGSNKEAARLSGVNVKNWEMMAYVIAGTYAGIGGISYAAVYTTVLPQQGQGFELYAIAGAVIGGTSLAGGIGTIFGTLIGVFIMSVLSVGLPSMNLQSHYQIFFTGVVVIGAVLLDMYRNKKATEVKILSRSVIYKLEMQEKIAGKKADLAQARRSGAKEADALAGEMAAMEREYKKTVAGLRAQERADRLDARSRERASKKALKKNFKD